MVLPLATGEIWINRNSVEPGAGRPQLALSFHPAAQAQAHAITWTPSAHTADSIPSVVAITADTYLPRHTPPVYPPSPYTMDVVAAFGARLLVPCVILALILGIFTGWFLAPRYFSRCRACPEETATTTTNLSHIYPVPLTPTAEVPLQMESNICTINASGAQMRTMDSRTLTRNQGVISTGGSEHDISNVAVTMAPAQSRPPSVSKRSIYGNDDTSLKKQSSLPILSMHALSASDMFSKQAIAQSSSPVTTDNVTNHPKPSRSMGRTVWPLTPITPSLTATNSTSQLHMRANSVPAKPRAFTLLKRSSAVLDLPSLALASTPAVSSHMKVTIPGTFVHHRAYVDLKFSRSVEDLRPVPSVHRYSVLAPDGERTCFSRNSLGTRPNVSYVEFGITQKPEVDRWDSFRKMKGTVAEVVERDV